MQHLPTTRILFAALVALTMVSFVTSLGISTSVNGLVDTMTSTAAVTLIISTIEADSNLPNLVRMLRYGDSGLHGAWADSCKRWSTATFLRLKHQCQDNRHLELLIFPLPCIDRLRAGDREEPIDESLFRGLLFHSNNPEGPDALRRLEEAEPQGLWWRWIAPRIAWEDVLRVQEAYHGGPLFRVGMVDLFNAKGGRQQLIPVYSAALTVAEEVPAKVLWPLYGLMRASQLAAATPHPTTTSHFTLIYAKFRLHSGFKTIIRLVRLWLCSLADQQCEPDGASAMFYRMIQGDSAVSLERESHLIMNALIVIVFGCGRFGGEEHRVLVDHIIPALPFQSDVSLSNFLWDAYTLTPFLADLGIHWRRLLGVAVRARLLAIAPCHHRPVPSLLLLTSDGIQYFRRWMIDHVDTGLLDMVVRSTAQEMPLELLFYAVYDWRGNIPALVGGNATVRRRLKQILQSLIDAHSAHLSIYTGEDPRRIWIHSNTMSFSGESRHLELIVVLLRIRLHYEEEGIPLDTDELTYDLCTETVAQLRSIHSPFIGFALDVVYPPWLGEDLRSRLCLRLPLSSNQQ